MILSCCAKNVIPPLFKTQCITGNISRLKCKKNGLIPLITRTFEGKKIGLIHGKDIDFEKRTCEGGIFIWDESYIGGFIPSLASVMMNDWTFYMINFKAIYAKIMLDNTVAINYNKLMGYQVCEPLNEDKGVQWMILTRESYEKHMKLLRKAIKEITDDGEVLKLENGDASDDLGKEIDLFYKGLPPDIQERGDTLLKWAREKELRANG
jgi:hypothetical protein